MEVMWCISEEAAETEPAWKGAGQEVGLQIWRIVVSIYIYTSTDLLPISRPVIVVTSLSVSPPPSPPSPVLSLIPCCSWTSSVIFDNNLINNKLTREELIGWHVTTMEWTAPRNSIVLAESRTVDDAEFVAWMCSINLCQTSKNSDEQLGRR